MPHPLHSSARSSKHGDYLQGTDAGEGRNGVAYVPQARLTTDREHLSFHLTSGDPRAVLLYRCIYRHKHGKKNKKSKEPLRQDNFTSRDPEKLSPIQPPNSKSAPPRNLRSSVPQNTPPPFSPPQTTPHTTATCPASPHLKACTVWLHYQRRPPREAVKASPHDLPCGRTAYVQSLVRSQVLCAGSGK